MFEPRRGTYDYYCIYRPVRGRKSWVTPATLFTNRTTEISVKSGGTIIHRTESFICILPGGGGRWLRFAARLVAAWHQSLLPASTAIDDGRPTPLQQQQQRRRRRPNVNVPSIFALFNI